MAKRTYPRPTSEVQGWDGELDDCLDNLDQAPIPLFEPTAGLFANLPAANQNDAGLAVFTDTTAGKILALSNNTTYRKIGVQAAAVNALTYGQGTGGGDTIANIDDPADSPASADALRDDLVANTIPDIRNAVRTLSDKFNELRTAMRNAGLLA